METCELEGYVLFQIKIAVMSRVPRKGLTVPQTATGCQTAEPLGTAAPTRKAVNVFQDHAQIQTALMANTL
jgi:hypothetical protein